MNIKNFMKDNFETISIIILLGQGILSILYMKETFKISETEIPWMCVSLLILLVGVIAVIWKKEDFEELIELVQEARGGERPAEEKPQKRKEPFDFMERRK